MKMRKMIILMIKREAKFGVLFRHYLKAKPIPSAAFELKQTLRNSIPFSDVQEHQINALLAANGSQGLLYKAPDDSRGVKPCDYLYLRNSKSFVVIKYPSFFVIIDVQDFVKEKKKNTRKSLTAKRARKIADIVVDL